MPRNVAVVFVHGILGSDINFAHAMQRALQDRLRALRTCVTFRSVPWADLIRGRQRDFLDRARAVTSISDSRLRQLVIEGLGDAAAYQKTKHRKNSIYYDIQNRIDQRLDELDVEPMRERPLIFIGHSLGCHIISSYLWDMNQLKQRELAEVDSEDKQAWETLRDATPFRRLDTVAGLVTMGSNMPLFTFTFGPERVFPITSPPPPGADGRRYRAAFPGVKLEPAVFDRARWLNFFSKNDVLGFPLKCLNEAYDNPRIEDIAVRSELRAWGAIPILGFYSAHTRYWTNEIVLSRTAELIRDTITAGGPEGPAATAPMGSDAAPAAPSN